MSSKKITAVRYQCDRCKVIKLSEIDSEIMQVAFTGWTKVIVDDDEKNFCEQCSKSFQEWISEFEPRRL